MEANIVRKTNTCYLCRGKDHFVKDCPKPPPTNTGTSTSTNHERNNNNAKSITPVNIRKRLHDKGQDDANVDIILI